MKKIFLFIVLFSSLGFSQRMDFDSTVTKGIKQIYNIKFNDAENTFRKLMADYPNEPAGRFFLAMIDWWKILLDLDVETYDDIFYQKLEDVIYFCDKILDKDKNNVEALFFKGGAIGFRGRLRAIRESWIKAADDGREALPIVEHASKLDPNNLDVQLGFGIYNYYASVIPEKYPMVKPLMLFFPSGDKEKGIKQLYNTAMNGKYAKYEARYFLMTLYYQFENNPYKADEFAKMLNSDFPDNPNFERWRGRISVKRGDYYLGSDIFNDVMNKYKNKLPGYDIKAAREAMYYIAVQQRNLSKTDTARVLFEECLKYCKETDKKEESGFQINTILYLGMLNDILGRRDDAVKYYNMLLDMKDYGESKNRAKQYLQTPYKE